MKKIDNAISEIKVEFLHGVTSKSVKERKEGCHCNGRIKSINHWECENDKII